MLGIEGEIEYSKNFESFEILESGDVHVHFADGSTTRGSMIVGADGIHSKVRGQLQPRRHLLDLERCITWGRTPLTKEIRERLSSDTLSWYMVHDEKSNVQAVVEPMIWSSGARDASQGRLPPFEDYVYWCICTTPAEGPVPQTAAERKEVLERAIETWHPEIKLLLQSAPSELSSSAPVLSSRPDIELVESEATGKVTLVGDAAHAMSPMGGSGASTAVLNATDLVATIHTSGIARENIRAFETRMAERAKAKIEHSFEGGKKFWKGREWYEYGAAST